MCFTLQDDPDMAEYALDGLKQVMAVKSRVVLPYLVPQVNTCVLGHIQHIAGSGVL